MTEAEAARLLGVRPGADDDTVRRAWRRRATRAHPDGGGSEAAFIELVQARDLLLAEDEPSEVAVRRRRRPLELLLELITRIEHRRAFGDVRRRRPLE